MAVPPPLNPKPNQPSRPPQIPQPPQPPRTPENPEPPQPSGKKTPTPRPEKPGNKGVSSTNKWLIAGSCLAAVLLITAVLLYFMTDLFDRSSNNDKDDMEEKDELNKEEDSADYEMPSTAMNEKEVVAENALMNIGYYNGQGIVNDQTFSLDIKCDNEGYVTGKYWNVLYCLSFDVRGHQDSDGSLDLMLTQTRDGTQVPLVLYTQNGVDYTGTLGKSKKGLNITLGRGSASPGYAPNVLQRWTIKGPDNSSILNETVNISQDSNGNYVYWYPTQGYANHLILRPGSNTHYLYNLAGGQEAYISVPYDQGVGSLGTLVDNAGQTFEMQRIE